jgi:predicted  nucleic acid-binding Zn-ribbon protein
MLAFKCQECGKKFKTVAAAERASYHGCPKCGGTDIDLDADAARPPAEKSVATEHERTSPCSR